MRDGITALLARFGHEVIAAVGDATALIEAVRADRPDIVVTDVRMPPGFTDEGLRAAVTLRRADPGLPVLVLASTSSRPMPVSCSTPATVPGSATC
jgi:DNA-binding NarL/FixJ family response regulator